MKITQKIREALIGLGMREDASDEEAEEFAKKNNVEVKDCSGDTPAADDDNARCLELLTVARQLGGDAFTRAFDAYNRERKSSAILTAMRANDPAPVGLIGLSGKEVARYSLSRAIQAVITGSWKGASLERQVSDEVAKRMGCQPGGFFVPMDILGRTQTVGTAGNGGNLVATEFLSGSFVELLRKRLVLAQLGVTMITGLVGAAQIPRQTAGITAGNKAEGADADTGTLTFDQIPLSPKIATAYGEYSKLLLYQSTPSIDQLLQGDLAAALAQNMEDMALNGSGSSNQPTGLLNTSGLGSVAIGTNGGVPTFAKMVEMETSAFTNNVYDDGTMAYLVNAATRGCLKTTEKAANTAKYIFENGEVNGYRCEMSNNLTAAGTKGTGTALSTAIFGRWSDLVLATWGALDITVDDKSQAKKGVVGITGTQFFDVAVRHAASFAKIVDLKTA